MYVGVALQIGIKSISSDLGVCYCTESTHPSSFYESNGGRNTRWPCDAEDIVIVSTDNVGEHVVKGKESEGDGLNPWYDWVEVKICIIEG